MRPSRSPGSIELTLALLAMSAPAAACPCGAPAGAAPAWTTVGERIALNVTAGWTHEYGTFDARARARPLPPGVSTERATLDLTAAWRALPSLELSAGLAGAWTRAAQPGTLREGISLGDSTFRARWESPAPRSPARPALALWGAIRAPTGDRDEGVNVLTAVGLGHWELSLGAQARWHLGRAWELSAAAELGLRAPATRGDATVTPGPRALVALAAVWRPSPRLALNASLSAWWEAPMWIRGEQSPDAGAYRVGPGAGASWQVREGLRVMTSVSVDPRVDGLGANGGANLRATLGITAALR